MEKSRYYRPPMTRDKYYGSAFELYNKGEINGDTYDAMLMNADEFCSNEDGGEDK